MEDSSAVRHLNDAMCNVMNEEPTPAPPRRGISSSAVFPSWEGQGWVNMSVDRGTLRKVAHRVLTMSDSFFF